MSCHVNLQTAAL